MHLIEPNSLDQAAGGIGLNVRTEKTKYMGLIRKMSPF